MVNSSLLLLLGFGGRDRHTSQGADANRERPEHIAGHERRHIGPVGLGRRRERLGMTERREYDEATKAAVKA